MILGICDNVKIFIWERLPYGHLPEFGDTVTYDQKTYKVIGRDFSNEHITLTIKLS